MRGGIAPSTAAGARREHAVVDHEIDARFRDEHGELFEELDRREDERARPVSPRVRERQADAAVREELYPFLRKRRAQQVVAQALEPRAVVGADGAAGMEIEARVSSVPRGLGFESARVGATPHPRHARAHGAAEHAAPGDGRGTERG